MTRLVFNVGKEHGIGPGDVVGVIAGPGHHIARSTATGTPLVTVRRADTAVAASRGSSWSTWTV